MSAALKIPANLGTWRHHNPSTGESLTFRPNGRLTLYEGTDRMAQNPLAVHSTKKTTSARIFVGLSVGEKPRWSYDDLVKAVTNALDALKRPLDASFIVQRGTYTARATTGETATEDSSQVVILNLGDWPSKEAFVDDMSAICEDLIVILDQEYVYLEIQRAGIATDTYVFASQAVMDRAKKPR